MNCALWTRRTTCFVLLGLACLALPAHAECPGECNSDQKISNLTGLDNEDGFGSRVARIGDLDGNGVDDLAVGAPLDDDGVLNAGAVWILFLASDGTVNSTQKISALAGDFPLGQLSLSDWFGTGLAWLGDLGPGAPTPNALAVGVIFDDDGANESGAVWILFLDSGGMVDHAQKISNTEGRFTGQLDEADQFGISMSALGDLDGDGVGDLVVGAFGDDDGGPQRGAVWILFLNSNGTVDSHGKISDTEGGFDGPLDDNDHFGVSVASLGDIDGDDVVDLAVGAHADDDGGLDRGAVWLLYLEIDTSGTDPVVTVKSHAKISDTEGGFEGGLDNSDYFGASVATPGDLDGDGDGELAVGAHYDDDGGENSGAVWILFLEEDGTTNHYQKISNLEGNSPPLDQDDTFGVSMSALGDFDGDGVGDLAVGASGDDDGGFGRGAVWLLFLHARLTLDVTSASLDWWPPGGAVSYDIVRGDLGSLQSTGGDFGPATDECLANDHPDTSLPYTLSPGSDEGFWFLVRRVYSMLEQGTYDTCGPSQVDSRDSEIAASGVACP